MSRSRLYLEHEHYEREKGEMQNEGSNSFCHPPIFVAKPERLEAMPDKISSKLAGWYGTKVSIVPEKVDDIRPVYF